MKTQRIQKPKVIRPHNFVGNSMDDDCQKCGLTIYSELHRDPVAKGLRNAREMFGMRPIVQVTRPNRLIKLTVKLQNTKDNSRLLYLIANKCCEMIREAVEGEFHVDSPGLNYGGCHGLKQRDPASPVDTKTVHKTCPNWGETQCHKPLFEEEPLKTTYRWAKVTCKLCIEDKKNEDARKANDKKSKVR